MQDLLASRFGRPTPVALGRVGGGYDDRDWTRRWYTLALQAAETGRIGCGFITRKPDQDASALDWVLDLAPPGAAAVFWRPAARR